LRQGERHAGGLVARAAQHRLLQIGHGAAAELTEDAIELDGEHVEGSPYAALAVGRKPIKGCASDHYRMRAQRERFGDVASAAEAAVDHDRQAITDSGGDFPENLDRRYTVVELPPAVIGEHDTVAAGV